MRTAIRPFLLLLVALVASCTWVPDALAVQGISITHSGPSDAPGLYGGNPRTELTLAPGAHRVLTLRFHNLTGRRTSLKLEVQDIQGSADPNNFLQLVSRAKFGARNWILLPADHVDLRDGDEAKVRVTIDVPADVSPGSHYAAVVGTTSPVLKKGRAPAGGSTLSSLALQVFVTIPGDLRYSGKIKEADAPRLIQRGSSYLPVSLVYENTGNVSDEVGGQLQLKSSWGSRVDEIPFKKQFFLRDSAREFRVVWTDPPWIGRFVPKITLVGKDGKEHTETLPAVYVIPPWYYIVAVVLAILFPFFWRWRDKRRIRRILEQAGVGRIEELDDDEFGDDADDTHAY